MKKNLKSVLCLFAFILTACKAFSQTRWTGATSVNWATASNWTAGVPTAAVDAVIGDAAFTGSFQPAISATAACRSLTVGGSVVSALTVSRTLTVSGNVNINANGSLINGNATLSLTGNWNNAGSYTTTSTGSTVIFSGTTQTLGGSNVTTFRRLRINSGSTVTLLTNVISSGSSSYIQVRGTLNPNQSPAYQATAASVTVSNNANLKVTTSTFTGNYSFTTLVLNAGSIVDYASTTVAQTVSSAYTYSTLRVSGGGTKSLAANLPALRSTSSSVGYLQVLAGTFDMGAYTAHRGTTAVGGTITVANDAVLRIGGTASFPTGYNTANLGLTGTVEYSGGEQTVAAKTYGNLLLTSSAGSVVKTMPATAFTVAGNLTSAVGSGTGVSFTAASNISVTGNLTIGSGTTFNGGAFSHGVTGNWTANGTFTGGTSLITLRGANATLSGGGTHNFNDLVVTGSGITASTSLNLNIAGNLSTSGSGTFQHAAPSVAVMTGTAKTIAGTGIVLNDLTVSGTVSTASSITVQGNLTVSGGFTATGGTVVMTGSGKTISGTGTKSFGTLVVSGTVTTASDFSVSVSLNAGGSFTGTAGTATFTGSATVAGAPNLYNVTENGTSLQLASNAVLGVAGAFNIIAGTVNTTSSVPNTVHYNGTGAQTVRAVAYNNLTVSAGNTKTAAGAVTVNNAFTIELATTFAAGSYTHSLLGNFANNGTFSAGTSNVQFGGSANTTVSGVTTFNALTLNKTSPASTVSLLSNVVASTVNMTAGGLLTGSSGITITGTRTGPGIISGSITRTHAFGTGTAYAFESPYNTVSFSAVTGVASVTVYVAVAPVADFPFGGAINRHYNISVPSGTYTATLRLHYEDTELGGNDENTMQLWRYNGAAWTVSGKNANNATDNWIERTGLTNLSNRWTCTDDGSVLRWNGSVSGDWNNASNWSLVQGTFSGAPTSNDIAEIGTGSFVNQPSVSTAVTVKGIHFGSVQAATLSLNPGGLLTTTGNISGTWSAANTHSFNTGAQNATVGGDLVLSDGTPGHHINLAIGTGTVTVAGRLEQSGSASLLFGGTGTLQIGKDFIRTGGTFNGGTGTVVYNGTMTQQIAGVAYNNLTVTKTAGIAELATGASVGGNLSVTAGEMDLLGNVSVAGSVSLSAGGTLDAHDKTLHVGGNWTNAGTFNAGTGTVVFNGTAAQLISTALFNNVTVNKASGTVSLTGAVTVGGDASVIAGTIDLGTYLFNHGSPGGSFSMAAGATLQLSGAANFPNLYTTYNLAATSLVHYNGTSAQSVAGRDYGHLTFSNGGVKTVSAALAAAGNLTINSGAQLNGGNYAISLYGDWVNGGTFVPATGDVLLNGSGKTVSGNTVYNDLTVNGGYTVAGSNITYNGHLLVSGTGNYAAGSGVATVNGDLTNNGTLTSSGTTTFTGTTVQTLRLVNALMSTSTGVVNFNGNVSPVLNSTTAPTFATLNINNTGGVNPSVGWTVLGPFTVSSGASFNGGVSSHVFSHAFTNGGTVTSDGGMIFNSSTAVTLNFGSAFSSNNSVILGGTGHLTLAGTPAGLQDVIVSNVNPAGIAPPSGWTLDGKFSILANSVFVAGSHTYVIGGDIESNGTLNGGTSTFRMTSAAGSLAGSPHTTFYHFTVDGDVTSASDFNVAGNFTNNGAYDGTLGAVIMTGSANATVGGTASPSTVAQLTVNKSPSATVSAAVDISSVVNLNVMAGTFFTSTFAVTQDGSGGVLVVAADATLRLGGTNTVPAFSGYGLDEASTVDYAGTTQTIFNTAIYGHLKISAAGNKMAPNFLPLTVMGDFTLSAGHFIAGNNTHNFAGDWTMTGGSFDATASTIRLNGFDDQTVTTLAPFNNFTLNKPIGLAVLGSNITVTNNLTFTLGKISIGSYNLTVAPGGFITGAGSARYIIAEGSGTVVQQVVAGVSKAFPIGTTAHYAPVTVLQASGSVTDNFSARIMPLVYENGGIGTPVTTGVTNATWVVNEAAAGGSNATVTVQWPAALELPGFYRAFCMPARYVGPEWSHGSATVAASGSNPYTVSRSGFTAFGYFTVAMEDVLPVVWVSLHGRNVGSRNHLVWRVATERNTINYIVEASFDGRAFNEVGSVAAGAASGEYRFTHEGLLKPVTYYRIKQLDADGRYSYSPVIKLSGTVQTNVITVGPNPVSGKAIVTVQSGSNGTAVLRVYSAAGETVLQQVIQLQAGTTVVPIDLSTKATGVYVIEVVGEGGEKQIFRIVKRS